MKKREYLKPDIEYVEFMYRDVILTSGEIGHETEPESYETECVSDPSQVGRFSTV